MSQNNARLGILLMIATTFVFALQDGISRHLAGEYNPVMVVMVRYWFFASFVVVYAMRKSGGFRAAVRTTQLPLQIFRGFLLAGEIIIALISFVYLGLVQTHAIFASYPLMVAALAGPVLGEKVGWRRWVAIGVGFVGMLVVLQPGATVFSPYMLVAILSSLMFAVYGLLTRFVARKDSAMTSFFWTGVAGCAFMTVIGVWFWEPMIGFDWVWMGILCLTGAGGHFLLIRTLEVAEASTVQPFAYLQLVFASLIGVLVFHEALRANVVLGAGIIVTAGLFTLWRERVNAK
ncbi:MAG: DMT family transporter [Proteobacteria bacterium]|nr:DMT family transporter [Pseudomonadota bacterium]MDA1285924.1 DMT family transporter [Pseudomonadota bacterium]